MTDDPEEYHTGYCKMADISFEALLHVLLEKGVINSKEMNELDEYPSEVLDASVPLVHKDIPFIMSGLSKVEVGDKHYDEDYIKKLISNDRSKRGNKKGR